MPTAFPTSHWTTTGPYPVSRCLLQRRVLDVVLGRVLVGQLVDDVEPLAVGVVDLDEGLPLIGKCVLREDCLDRALRFARPAVGGIDAAGQRERVLARDDRAERLLFLSLDGLD